MSESKVSETMKHNSKKSEFEHIVDEDDHFSEPVKRELLKPFYGIDQ